MLFSAGLDSITKRMKIILRCKCINMSFKGNATVLMSEQI